MPRHRHAHARRRRVSTRGQHHDASPAVAQEDLRAVLNALPALVGYWDRELRNRMANEAYVDYFGTSPEQMPGMHISDVLGPELYAKNHPYMLRALAGETQTFDRTIRNPSGTVRYTQSSYVPDIVNGHTRGFSVLTIDITARREAEAARAAAERRFRTLFDMAPIGTFHVSDRGVVLDANRAAADVLGRSRESLIGVRPADFTHPDDVERSSAQLAGLLAGEQPSYRTEKRYVRGDGTTVWAQLDATLLAGGEGEPVAVLAQIQDISARRAQQAELKRLVDHDSLTGLLNRRGLLDELDRRWAGSRTNDVTPALLMIDLDRFKAVNDAHGHAAGDAALAAIAALLRARLRSDDVIARLGGDEFAVILAAATGDDARRIGIELADAIRGARLGVPDCPITASIGIAFLDEHRSAADALERADLAMYGVKRQRNEPLPSGAA